MARIRKILVPVDGSPPSSAALAQAVALAEDLDATIEVLHVNGPDRFEVGSTTAAAAGPRRDAEHTMAAAVAAAQERLGDRLTSHETTGDPIREILREADEAGADLVVMGTHGRVGRLHSILGSVAEAVVRNSTHPVLTVREPDGDAESFAERIHGRRGLADHEPSSG
jgi:nucleotide-binding universal stress UspA family protein